MLEHVDSVADNRIALGSSRREDVLNRDRETRPTALVPVEVRKGQRNGRSARQQRARRSRGTRPGNTSGRPG